MACLDELALSHQEQCKPSSNLPEGENMKVLLFLKKMRETERERERERERGEREEEMCMCRRRCVV